MKVLSIGYGRHLFDIEDVEHKRLNRCAKKVKFFDHIVFTKKSDGLDVVFTENNFTIHPTNSSSKLSMIFDAVRIGGRIIKEKKIDVISTQDPFETGLVGFLLKYKHPKVRLQVQEHGDVLSSLFWRKEKLSNSLRYWLAFVVLEKADIVRVVSDRTQKFLSNKLGKDKKIVKLPVVIDTATFAKQNVNEKSEHDSNFVFLTAARFVPQKNFSLMLEAFAEVSKKFPNARLRIFGSGPLESQINEQITNLGIRESVELHAWTDNLANEMSQADAYLLTSNYEGWARVLIEAMMLNLPVVTTDVGCVHEVLQDKTHGLVVPVNDKSKLVQAMIDICSNRELYMSIKNNLQNTDLDSIPGTNIDIYASQWAQTLR